MAHEYVPPSEIDGSPTEVERAAIDQLQVILEETAVQARNAHMTRILDATASTTPAELAENWEACDRKAAFDRLQILVQDL